MAAASHNPAFAKKVGIPVSVAKDFNQADKGKKFKDGGMAKLNKLFKGKDTYAEEVKEAKAIKSGKITPAEYAKGEKMEEKKMAKGGVAKTVTKEMEYDYKTGKKSFAGSTAKRDAHAEKEGKRVAKDLAYDKAKKYARGGGIEVRGKTRGKMC
jgi:hypothetical protein